MFQTDPGPHPRHPGMGGTSSLFQAAGQESRGEQRWARGGQARSLLVPSKS